MITATGTPGYKAPEMLQGGKYTESIDMWAAGVSMYETVERHLPFTKDYHRDTIEKTIAIDYNESEVWNQFSEHARELLHNLLKPASDRLTIEEAVHWPWFMADTDHEPSSVMTVEGMKMSSCSEEVEESNQSLSVSTPMIIEVY